MNKLFYKHTKQSWKYKQYCLLLIEIQLTDWSSKWQISYSDFWQLQSLASSINLSYMWSQVDHVIIRNHVIIDCVIHVMVFCKWLKTKYPNHVLGYLVEDILKCT